MCGIFVPLVQPEQWNHNTNHDQKEDDDVCIQQASYQGRMRN
jgi:hypothetical protein